MENLFLDTDLGFEKTSARGVGLGSNPEEWDSEIMKEAYRQVPYLSDYEVSVILDKRDEEKGYAFGHLSITNQAGRPLSFGSANQGSIQEGLAKEAKIPLIVKEGSLRPLRVFVNNEGFEPLSERRLGTALFRGDLSSQTGTSPGDQSLVEQLYPPYRLNVGLNSGIKQASVLSKIASTISSTDRDVILERVKTDPAILYAVSQNDSLSTALDKISKAEPLTAAQAKDALKASISPDVVQVEKGPGFYKVKTANSRVFEPVETKLSREEIGQHFPSDVVSRIDAEGYVTSGRSFTPESDEAVPQEVTTFGRYRVKQANGRWSEGWVFPKVVDLDMNVRSTTLFTDGLHGCTQEKVAGVESEGAVFPAGSVPRGTGSFMAAYDDKAIATLPLTILNSVRTEDENFYRAETMDGRKVKISMAPGLKKIGKIDDTHYVVPDEMEFIPYRHGAIKLVEGQDFHDFAKKASSTIVIRSDRECYSLEGDPLDKVASEERSFVPRHQAEFLLVAMGAHPSRAKAKLAEADLGGQSQISGMNGLTRYEDVRQEVIQERVIPKLASFPNLRVDLLKEASAIEDDATVDAVLALNFINPENISLFVENVPELEKASSRLAELYVASQLGMHNVNEDAVLRAMRGMDGVITGLRSLEEGGGAN